ncbi:MAG: hypothetical protein ACOCRX_11040 [Candidatus Woesearchaeota archaeon]
MPSCSDYDLDLFLERIENYDKIFYKWLAPNDYIWSEKKELHQSGLLIPREHLDFLEIEELSSSNLTREFEIYWFFEGEVYTRRDVSLNYS